MRSHPVNGKTLNFSMNLYLPRYIVYASSQSSDETAHVRSLARALAAKFRNFIIYWLIFAHLDARDLIQQNNQFRAM